MLWSEKTKKNLLKLFFVNYLLRYLKPNNNCYLHVFNDLYDVFEDGIEKPEYNECMFEIIRYISGERPTFPLISDFYY